MDVVKLRKLPTGVQPRKQPVTVVTIPQHVATLLHMGNYTHVEVRVVDEGILLVPLKETPGIGEPEWLK